MGCSMSVFMANTFMLYRSPELINHPPPGLLHLHRFMMTVPGPSHSHSRTVCLRHRRRQKLTFEFGVCYKEGESSGASRNKRAAADSTDGAEVQETTTKKQKGHNKKLSAQQVRTYVEKYILRNPTTPLAAVGFTTGYQADEICREVDHGTDVYRKTV